MKERGELQRIKQNLVAENITGLIQAAAHCPGQMGCKVFTQLQVQKLFTPPHETGLHGLDTTPQSTCCPPFKREQKLQASRWFVPVNVAHTLAQIC